MKQIQRKPTAAIFSLSFISLVYFLLLLGTLYLAETGFAGVFSSRLFNTPSGILLLVIIPVSLLLFAGIFLYIGISKSMHSPEYTKTGLSVFFKICLLLFAVALPQSVLVSRFVGNALESWFDNSSVSSLSAGEYIDTLYLQERRHNVENVAHTFLTGLSISNYRGRPADWISDMRQMDSYAVSCQVYLLEKTKQANTYTSIMEVGDSLSFVPKKILDNVEDGFLTFDEDGSFLRYGAIVRYTNSTYVCIYTSAFPQDYISSSQLVTKALSRARTLVILEPYYSMLGIWVFILFALPSLCIAILAAWSVSMQIGRPARVLRDAFIRRKKGDKTVCLCTEKNTELDEAILLCNSDIKESDSRPDTDKKLRFRL